VGGAQCGIVEASTEQQLKDAPEFSDDSWQDRDWEVRTHRHYGAPEYWETGAGV
jgi:hypothetical protein